MKILMVGASGKYAKALVPELKKFGLIVDALVRDKDKGEIALRNGADRFSIGDLSDLHSLQNATRSVDGVFHIGPAFAADEVQFGKNIVKASMAANVKKFVFSGAIHPTISSMINHANKQPVEQAVFESGLNYVVLQPTMFMQNFATAWQQIKLTKEFGLPFDKRQKVSYVDYRDVAEVAATAFATSLLDYGTFELCAQGLLDRVEIVNLMSEATGLKIEATEPAFENWATASKIPHGIACDGMQKMFANYNSHGFPGGNALILSTILKREPRSLINFFQELEAKSSQ